MAVGPEVVRKLVKLLYYGEIHFLLTILGNGYGDAEFLMSKAYSFFRKEFSLNDIRRWVMGGAEDMCQRHVYMPYYRF